MPQFDPANFAPQLVWLAIIFAILYFGVVQLTLPKLGKVIEGRTARVDGDIQAAALAKAEADDMTQAYERDIAAAKAEAQSSVAASHEASMRDVAAKLAALNADLDAQTQAAEAVIAARRDTALNDIDGLARAMGDDIVRRLLGADARPGAA